MKWIALGFLLLIQSSLAATLYTVTIKLSPSVNDVQVLLGPVGKNSLGDFTKVSYTNTSVFKLPAGKYQVFADKRPKTSSIQTFQLSSANFTVKGNMTVVVPIKMLKSLPDAGEKILSSFLLDITGTFEDCYKPDVRSVCATTDKSYKIVQGYVQLHSELNQIYPWISMGQGSYLGQFRIDGNLYSMILFEHGDGSTDITWSIEQ